LLGTGDQIFDQFIANALMIPLSVVMLKILVDRFSQKTVTKPNHSVQAFILDGSDKALGVGIGIGIGSLEGSSNHLESVRQGTSEALAEFCISIED
jgi:hypothetical protein